LLINENEFLRNEYVRQNLLDSAYNYKINEFKEDTNNLKSQIRIYSKQVDDLIARPVTIQNDNTVNWYQLAADVISAVVAIILYITKK